MMYKTCVLIFEKKINYQRLILVFINLGGIQEAIDLQSMTYTEKNKFWTELFISFRKKSIIGCSINPDPHVKEARLSNGLVKGHAFTITNIAIIDIGYRTEKLLRIRNPWGNEVEWKGTTTY